MNEYKFSVELWVGLQNSEEKIACSEKTGESRTVNTEEKRRHFWKNNTRNKFSAYLPQIFA